MIQAKITHVLLTDIKVPREVRQRTHLMPESVLDLAISIGKNQWISPILIDAETNCIVSGERRLTAVKLLHRTLDAVNAGRTLDKLESQLAPVCQCKQAAWEQWTKIPAQLGTKLTEIDRIVFEFIENKEREDLSWQDKAKAVYDIHAKCKAQGPWTNRDTAKLIGLNEGSVSLYLDTQRALLSKDESIVSIVKESSTPRAAMQAVDRIRSRRGETKLGVKLTEAGATAHTKPTPKPAEPTKDEEPDSPPSLGEQHILNQDFQVWANFYNGPKFNFVHCDFPYGIDFNKGGGQSTAQDTLQLGQYSDSEDTYWALIQTLYEYRETLLAPSCHIMFWFGQRHRRKTEDAFRDLFKAQVQDYLMIWHCSDNSGICPDPNRYGRRTYETAMLITLGDRMIAKAKALSCSFPRNEERIHRSQKPLSVLHHFFPMFVDGSTTMLDPTCGSGTSLIVARNLGAKHVLGIEKDAQAYTRAVEYFNKESQL